MLGTTSLNVFSINQLPSKLKVQIRHVLLFPSNLLIFKEMKVYRERQGEGDFGTERGDGMG